MKGRGSGWNGEPDLLAGEVEALKASIGVDEPANPPKSAGPAQPAGGVAPQRYGRPLYAWNRFQREPERQMLSRYISSVVGLENAPSIRRIHAGVAGPQPMPVLSLPKGARGLGGVPQIFLHLSGADQRDAWRQGQTTEDDFCLGRLEIQGLSLESER